MKGRAWTKEDDNILRRIYVDSSINASCEVLNRTKKSVYKRAIKLKLKKVVNTSKGSIARINLIHQNNVVKNMQMGTQYDFTEAVGSWFKEVRPALYRGEKITLEIELDKRYL